MKKIFTLLCCLIAAFTASAENWTGTWAAAPEWTGAGDMPKKTTLTGNSVRQIVHVSVGGKKLRVQLSNELSNQPVEIQSIYIADALDGKNINPKTAKYLKFDGKKEVTIESGKAVFSDALEYDLKPLQLLSITIHYGETPKNATSHRGSRTTSYIMEGKSNPKKEFVVAEQLAHWYSISAIDVMASNQPCIAVLGNSITDGRGTTTDKQNRWTDVCAEALDGKVGILNLGIGGNCVLRGGLSEPAVKRFDRDILGQRGLTGILIFEGVNDIGGSKASEQTAQQLIEAYETFIQKAREKGLKVYGGTITPIGNTDYWSYFHEAARQTVNEWIRTCGKFDAVIDFDKVLCDPANPTQIRSDYQFDRLHPNAAGYKAMGEEAAKVLQPHL